MLKIGNYVPASAGQEAIIERDWYGQGWIVKDEDAFLNHPDKVCYIPELSDDCYTRNDFLEMCSGQEKLAEMLFYILDWQTPSSALEEVSLEDGWGWCPTCKKYFPVDRYLDPTVLKTTPCPICGAILE